MKGHSGKKSFKNLILWFKNPIKNIDKPKLKERYNVIEICAVKAIPKGIILSKLHNKIK